MQTVALAVWTLPQTTLGLADHDVLPEPVTVIIVPARVLWSPATLSGARRPGTTWLVRTR